jgi:cytochrome c-type biogenesis protein CcmF
MTMIAEFGHYALVLAVALALVQASVPMVGARTNDPVLMAVAGPTAVAQFCFIAIAFAALTMCYVRSDFSVVDAAMGAHPQPVRRAGCTVRGQSAGAP